MRAFTVRGCALGAAEARAAPVARSVFGTRADGAEVREVAGAAEESCGTGREARAESGAGDGMDADAGGSAAGAGCARAGAAVGSGAAAGCVGAGTGAVAGDASGWKKRLSVMGMVNSNP